MSKGIFRMNIHVGRYGDLHGIFIAKKEDVEELVKSKKEVYFGEVLGKHSEICGSIDHSEIKLITDDLSVIEMFKKYNMETGYNPFDYIYEEEEE